MKRREVLTLWLPLLAYLGLLYVLSAQTRLPGSGLLWDKLLHVAAYSVLAVLALRAFHGGWARPRWPASAAALLLTIGYGVLDEIHQSYVPGRQASVGDVVADALGFFVAWTLVRLGALALASADRAEGAGL